MKTLFTLVVLIGLCFSIINCNREDSDTVVQDKIWAQYTLKYDADQDVTYAQATFRFSNATGTLLQLKSPAQVTFNGELLSFKVALAYYEKTFAGKIDSGSFEYIDLDHDTFINIVKLPSPIAFPTGFDTLSKSAAFSLVWDGNNLLANESVTISVKGTAQNDLQVFFTNTLNANNMVMPLTQLTKLGAGAGTAYMTKDLTLPVAKGTSAGGLTIGRYKAKDKSIVIVN